MTFQGQGVCSLWLMFLSMWLGSSAHYVYFKTHVLDHPVLVFLVYTSIHLNIIIKFVFKGKLLPQETRLGRMLLTLLFLAFCLLMIQICLLNGMDIVFLFPISNDFV